MAALPWTRIDTHAAAVFLAGGRALKIKRAVRFPFLDYSTLARRKVACEAEIAVNRAFAPQIYRRVVAITRSARRRPRHRRRRRAGRMGGGDAAFRRDARRSTVWPSAAASTPRSPTRSAARWPRRMRRRRLRRIRASPPSLPKSSRRTTPSCARRAGLFAQAAVEALTRSARSALSNGMRPLLAARAEAGLVRRCHGDLHLGNIVLIDKAPVLFDAIEFDSKIASGDVLYDLAFLLMDLIERRLKAPPISCSTAISPKRAGSQISTRSPRCHFICRCARRSAPRSARQRRKQA